MATKADFTAEEWDILRQAPLMASMIVAIASPSGPLGLIKESAAVGKVIREAADNAKTPLLQSLCQDLRHTISFPRTAQSSSFASEAAVAKLKEASALLAQKASPEEAEEVIQWLNLIAQRTAEATKEGGFLSFGGTLVSDKERAALNKIKSALSSQAA